MMGRSARIAREAFGETLVELGALKPELVVLDADISSSLKTKGFIDRYPNRHINFGVAEQNMMLSAAGLATTGLLPLACTYATFASMRACEQLRSFICYGNLNVKIIASHGGIEVGWDGPTHQATEDVAIVRSMPNMTVVVPADSVATSTLLYQVVDHPGPVYFRMGRNPVPDIYDLNQEFRMGKAIRLREGKDIALVAMGVMVSIALQAAEELSDIGIQASVFDMHTIKPIDEEALIDAASHTAGIVTVEDHNIIGGLGSAVSELLSEKHPVPIIRIGVRDRFAESGDPAALFDKYGMSANHVVEAAKKILTCPGFVK